SILFSSWISPQIHHTPSTTVNPDAPPPLLSFSFSFAAIRPFAPSRAPFAFVFALLFFAHLRALRVFARSFWSAFAVAFASLPLSHHPQKKTACASTPVFFIPQIPLNPPPPRRSNLLLLHHHQLTTSSHIGSHRKLTLPTF